MTTRLQTIPAYRLLVSVLRLLAIVLLFILVAAGSARAQEDPFDVSAYKAFLEANANITANELMVMHPAGNFLSEAATPFQGSYYADSVRIKMRLTAAEEKLGNQNGFFVTERLSYDSFGSALRDVYTNDLPVFISTDAVLHAIHMSYNDILFSTEFIVLAPKLKELLAALHAAVPDLQAQYSSLPEMSQPLRDLDVFLTVPRTLLEEGPIAPVFSENMEEVQTLLELIEEEETGGHELFAETCRQIDFSQFIPRGHYTDEESMTRYFQAMMWFGRTEVYLIGPKTSVCEPTDEDVQRQSILAMLVDEAIEAAGADGLFAEIEELIQLFVGESDNVTLENLRELQSLSGIDEASDLLDESQFAHFQQTLSEQAWSIQRIQSQILVSGSLNSPEGTMPASAFLLFGQRFVIDSYVTSEVVFDQIPGGVRRMLPNPLDVLFALGNDAAAQLLEPELNRFSYANNMAALRYLIDSYDADFWDLSLYNGWLSAIRTLNPPEQEERASLPSFMQTAAWWQEKMNTQLAGWTQLRHDNLLYAKQSYTSIPICQFPFTYIEPIPDFYKAVSGFARNAQSKFESVSITGRYEYEIDRIVNYFGDLAGVNDTLAVVAQKELDGIPFSEDEKRFLRRVIFDIDIGCAIGLGGWYTRMFYGGGPSAETPDMVVADIHTAPTDETGSPVGWVLHVGTGPVNMAIVTAEVPGEGPIAFTGPVMSYYEHLSTGFNRLTDEVWETSFSASPSRRPEFVNLYMADSDGEAYEEFMILSVNIEAPEVDVPLPAVPTAAQNYPNPFTDWTNITFTVPVSNTYKQVELLIYDGNGRLIDQLVNEALPSGHYSIRWDGILPTGGSAASGVYYARLKVGDVIKTTPMARVR